VETADGTRFQIQYPDGTSIDPSNGDLIGPNGEIIATLGGTLELRGKVNEDAGSICQIGPIFDAVEVLVR
jgi:hypothetical protein